jgi:acetyl esterase/lipase
MQIASTVRLIWQLTPVAIKTAVLSVLRLSHNTGKQDIRTEVTVAIIRKLTSVPRPLASVQRYLGRDPGITGPIWISKVAFQVPPESDVLDVLVQAIKDLGDGSEHFTLPAIVPVEAEWTGSRRGVSKNAPRPNLSEEEHYQNLLNENPSDTTILYFHGGAYCLMDPASHRITTGRLSKRTNGRVLSVRYRLAPQHPFPAALLDAFIAYLSLLSPPPGSHHGPIPASSIVFAGDSAGGGLSTALLLLLLHLQRSGTTHLTYHGRRVALSPPAGIATNSPWLDVTHSLPSVQHNARYDYLQGLDPDLPSTHTGPPPDEIWPTSPPRAEIYCEASMLTHPLVSPNAAGVELWAGTPPVWMVCGEELLMDNATAAARTIWRAGGRVEFVGYEGMPHCFAMVFGNEDCFARWGAFCVDVTVGEDAAGKGARRETGTWVRTLRRKGTGTGAGYETYEVGLGEICGMAKGEVLGRMRAAKKKVVVREEELVRKWEGEQRRAKL